MKDSYSLKELGIYICSRLPSLLSRRGNRLIPSLFSVFIPVTPSPSTNNQAVNPQLSSHFYNYVLFLYSII